MNLFLSTRTLSFIEIKEDDTATIKLTHKAHNCVIESMSIDSYNILANKKAEFSDNTDIITPLNLPDQNNFAIILGITKKEDTKKIHNITSYADLANQTNSSNLKIVKVICSDQIQM